MALSGIAVSVIFVSTFDSFCYMTYPALLFAKVKVRKVIICKGKTCHCFLFVVLLSAKVIVFFINRYDATIFFLFFHFFYCSPNAIAIILSMSPEFLCLQYWFRHGRCFMRFP